MNIITLSVLLVMEVLVIAVGVSTSATGTSSITDRIDIDGPIRVAFGSLEKLTGIPFIINRAAIRASDVTLQHSLSCCARGSGIVNSPVEKSAARPPCVPGERE